MAAVFQVDGLPAAGLEAFGIWTGVGESAMPPVWRASWSGDISADLAHADTRLRRSSEAVAVAEVRLDRHVRQSAAGPVYGLSMAAPEAALNAFIDTAIPNMASAWSRIVEDFNAVLATAKRMLADMASVESLVDGRLFGRTVVSWSGSQVSVWSARPAHREVDAHMRVLDLAIRTRAAFLRMVAVVARAAKVLTAFATPLGPVLALPAAWKFVEEVVRELSWLRERP